jgi:hypothetical protein
MKAMHCRTASLLGATLLVLAHTVGFGGEGEFILKAGATLPRRDAVDERIVREVREEGGHIIKWVKDAGGWPEFPSAVVSSAEPKQHQIGLRMARGFQRT